MTVATSSAWTFALGTTTEPHLATVDTNCGPQHRSNGPTQSHDTWLLPTAIEKGHASTIKAPSRNR